MMLLYHQTLPFPQSVAKFVGYTGGMLLPTQSEFPPSLLVNYIQLLIHSPWKALPIR
ncbi:hypothetical protein I315_06820 [Cryptococcus gattii Ru294]|nr:hypothetical protein I315_06820 [Cryptococcus gattii Ru294]